MRFCLVDDILMFLHAFLHCRGQYPFFTCVFTLKRNIGRFYMRFCLAEDRPPFIHAFFPSGGLSIVHTYVCAL